MTYEMQIDLTPFLCEAFASNKGVHKLIEKIYEQNKVEYYQLAKASKWYNHEIITCQSITKEIVMKRVLAILLEGDPEKILQIIRKGWKSIYNLVKNQGLVKPSKVISQTIPLGKTSLDKITNDEFNAYVLVVVILTMFLKKELDERDDAYIVFMQSCYARLQWADEGWYRFSLQSLTPEDRKKVRVFKEKIYEDAKINRYWISHTDPRASDLVKSYSDGLSFLFDTEKLTSSIIEDEPLSERDIEEILAAYYVIFQNQDKTEGAKFLAAGHIIKALLRAYRHLKEQHFKTSRETLYLDLDTTQHEAKEARLEVKRQEWAINQKDKEIQNLQKRIKDEYGRAVAEYQGQVKTAAKERELLQHDVDRLQLQVQELETMLFTPDIEAEHGEPVDLSALRGVIVGGRGKWHARMKDVLPDTWRFIHPDSDIDLALIAGADIVFFFTGYLSHAVYYAVIGEARRRNIPVGYLKRINEAECLAEIQYEIRKRGLICENI